MATMILIAATAFSAIGQIQQANAAADAQKYEGEVAAQNSVIAEQNARREKEAAMLEEERQRDVLRRNIGSANVARAKSGITQAGSALFVEQDSLIQGELDALLIRHRGDISANNFRTQASQFRSQSSMFKSQARQTKTAGLIGATGTILSGAASVYGGKSPFAGGGTVKSGWNPATQPKYVA